MKLKVTYVNPAFCYITGFDAQEMVGQYPPYAYWPSAEVGTLDKAFRQVLQEDYREGIQAKFRRKDGSVFYARVYSSALINSQGKQTGWLTSMVDITESIRTRQQLVDAHERFTKVLESLSTSISIISLKTRELLFANPRYRQWFGGDNTGHERLISKTNHVSIVNEKHTITKTDSNEDIEIYIQEMDLWLEVRFDTLQWVDGQKAQMIIASDITARRLSEAREEEHNSRMQSVGRLITMGEMASSLSHELNQPLTAINNYCSGMLRRLKNEQIDTETLTVILGKTAHQAQRAGRIIDRIRDFVKRNKPQYKTFSIQTLIEDTLDFANIEMRRLGISLVTDIAEDLPLMTADPVLIEQVLLNLLKNAAEATELSKTSKKVLLDIKKCVIYEGTIQKSVVQFCVTDFGKGIHKNTMKKLYDTFFTTKLDGMGIGLSLCRSIVEAHKGRIDGKNLYENGRYYACQFCFWLPIDVDKIDTT
jgi:PAS domain S-box-containing protein